MEYIWLFLFLGLYFAVFAAIFFGLVILAVTALSAYTHDETMSEAWQEMKRSWRDNGTI